MACLDTLTATCNATIINWSDIVGNKTYDDGGYIGDILKLGHEHIVHALDNGNLIEKEAGIAYTQLIQSSITQGIQFGVSKRLKELETDNARASLQKLKSEVKIAEETAKLTECKTLTCEYERVEIKPWEKALGVEKVMTERILNGVDTTAALKDPYALTRDINKSLPKLKRISSIETIKHTNVSAASLVDKKYLEILKQQLNYRAMIFGDEEVTPAPLAIANDGSTAGTYGQATGSHQTAIGNL